MKTFARAVGQIKKFELRLGSYQEILPKYRDTADLAILDLPYGITSTRWDQRIDLTEFWLLLNAALKSVHTVAAFAVQRFASELIASNRDNFKYDLIWRKPNATNPFQAKQRPMRSHETILIFSLGKPFYEPQMVEGKPYVWDSTRSGGEAANIKGGGRIENDGARYPKSVLDFPQDRGLHPTQKPVSLCRWLIRSYCPPKGTVLDPAIGSGTVGVAARAESRNFVGIEIDPEYYQIATSR